MNNKNWIELEAFESAILDSNITMKLKKKKKKGNRTYLYEESEGTYILKLSSMIIKHLAMFSAKIEPASAQTSGYYIVRLMEKMQIRQSYLYPSTKTDEADFLYKQAFDGTFVYTNYLHYHEKD